MCIYIAADTQLVHYWHTVGAIGCIDYSLRKTKERMTLRHINIDYILISSHWGMEFEMFKKIGVFAFVCIFALLSAACGETVNRDNQVSTKTGVLIEVSAHVISIQAPDGTTYTFGVNDGTTVHGSEKLGNTVSVIHDGEYSSGVIASSVTTIAEVDHESSSGKGSTDDPAAPQPKEPKSSDETIWYMTGTVNALSSNQLQLLYEDGHTYKVTIDSSTKVEHEVVVGCVARVFHKGRMVDGMVATEIHFISATPSDDPNTVWYLTGVVTEISETHLLLLYEDDKTYTINRDENTRSDPGIEVGTRVRVFHKGHLADEMLATEVRLASLLVTQRD